MPTNRTRRTRTSNRPVIPKALYYYFKTGNEDQSGFAEMDRYNEFLISFPMYKGNDIDALWNLCREEIISEWIKKHPGTRPWAWWEWESPSCADCSFYGTLPEPRQRLGGIGTPNYEVLAYAPHFDKGIPTGWVSKFDEEYYNGRKKDIHGNPIGTKYKEGDFKGKAIDPEDPPVFESEAAYLDRHGLLTETEKKYLAKHPELLEPEKVEITDNDE